MRYIHGILHKALADAQRKGTVLRNVAALADPPKLSSSKKREMRVWNAGELRDFLLGVGGERAHAAFFLAAHTGMRRGEVLGLRWADMGLDKSRLSVRQAIISVAYEVKVSDVKTGTGRRTINLDARTVGVLRAWRKAALAERMLVGPAFTDNDLGLPPARRDPHPPRRLQSDLRPGSHPAGPAGNFATRSSAYTCEPAPARRGPGEGRQRTAGPCQSGVHTDGLPARHPRHAGGSRQPVLEADPRPRRTDRRSGALSQCQHGSRRRMSPCDGRFGGRPDRTFHK